MGAAVPLRMDLSAGELRQLAKRAEDVDQARRLLSLAAVLDGQNRKVAAEIGAMDRQTLRDWVHRFNAKGPEGLVNGKAPGPVPKLSAEQKQDLKRIVDCYALAPLRSCRTDFSFLPLVAFRVVAFGVVAERWVSEKGGRRDSVAQYDSNWRKLSWPGRARP